MKRTDCLWCGEPRTDAKAGYCRDCMEWFLACGRLNGRRMVTCWRLRVYPEDGGNPLVPTWSEVEVRR